VGATLPELTAALPGVPVISRTASNAWDDRRADSIRKTGRKQLLITGVSLEICATWSQAGIRSALIARRCVARIAEGPALAGRTSNHYSHKEPI
jgi:hypothetical protein